MQEDELGATTITRRRRGPTAAMSDGAARPRVRVPCRLQPDECPFGSDAIVFDAADLCAIWSETEVLPVEYQDGLSTGLVLAISWRSTRQRRHVCNPFLPKPKRHIPFSAQRSGRTADRRQVI